MKSELENLLMIPEDHFSSLVKDLECNLELPSRIKAQFHYISLRDGIPRVEHFILALESGLISYCLKREKLGDIDHLTMSRLNREARSMFVRNEKSGEPGELALYMFLESKLKAPQILSKMNLKTSGNMHYNGSDAVHMKIKDDFILLFFGESKIYKDLGSSVDAALDSIASFYFDETFEAQTQLNFEMNLIRNHLDVKNETLKEKIKGILHPWKGNKENLRYINPCFIIFEWDYLNKLSYKEESPEKIERILKKKYEEQMEQIIEKLKSKISEKNEKNIRFHFFFMPVPNVEEFRKKFIKILNLKGDNNE